MQLMIAAAPPLRQMACGAQLPIANAAYRIENGVLCALPMPPACGAVPCCSPARRDPSARKRQPAWCRSAAAGDTAQ